MSPQGEQATGGYSGRYCPVARKVGARPAEERRTFFQALRRFRRSGWLRYHDNRSTNRTPSLATATLRPSTTIRRYGRLFSLHILETLTSFTNQRTANQ